MRHLTIALFIIVILLLAAISASSQTVWLKYTGNPVLDLGPPGSWDVLGVGASRVIRVGDTLKMWYSGRTTLPAYSIGYAWSTDKGITWTKYANNPVLSSEQPWEDGVMFLADVVYVNSQYKMWYTAAPHGYHHIGYATSPNGIVWSRRPNPVLDPGPSSWDSRTVGWPSILGPDSLGQYKMWFQGYPPSFLMQIGYATATNETTWTKANNINPILRVESSASWDNNRLEGPTVLYNGHSYEMWYSGHGNNDIFTYSRIGYATSLDGKSWTKFGSNPVLQPGPSSWDAVSVFSGDVLLEGNIYYLWYSGFDGSKFRTGYAVSPKGMSVSVLPMRDSLDRTKDTVWVKVRVSPSMALSFSVEIESPDGTPVDTVALLDDGAHGDSLIADGVFANTWIPGDKNSYYLDLKLTLHDPLRFEMNNIAVFTKVTSVLKQESVQAERYYLGQNFPNPFNPSTEIQFSLPQRSRVTLTIFDLLGREVATLVSEELSAGSYSTRWDAAGFPSGVYLYRLQADEFAETKKLLLLR